MAKRHVVFIAMMMMMVVQISMAQDFDKKEFVRDVERAQSLAAKGKYSDAITFWEKLNGKYGGAQGHYENALGDLYFNAKQYEKAEGAYLQGVALKGKYPRLYTGLAFVYLHQSKPAEAEKWARRATVEFSNWWLGYYVLGEIARRNDNAESAKYWLSKSLEVEPQPQTFWLLAIVCYELKDYQAVVDSMEAAINLDSQYLADEDGMKVSAVSLAQLGRFNDAYAAIDILKKNNSNVIGDSLNSVLNDIKKLEQSL